MNEKRNDKFLFIGCILLIVVGCGLLIAGFCVPPTGVIDGSILVAFGEILTFIGSVVGIDYNYRFKNITKK